MHLELDKDERRWLAAAVGMQIEDCRERGTDAGPKWFRRRMTERVAELEGLLVDIERGAVDLDPWEYRFREHLGWYARFVRTSGNPEADRQALFYENVALRLEEAEVAAYAAADANDAAAE